MASDGTTPARHWGWFVLVLFLTVGAAAGWVYYARWDNVWRLILALSLTVNAATSFIRWRRAAREQRDA
jgi:hypothetical protein